MGGHRSKIFKVNGAVPTEMRALNSVARQRLAGLSRMALAKRSKPGRRRHGKTGYDPSAQSLIWNLCRRPHRPQSRQRPRRPRHGARTAGSYRPAPLPLLFPSRQASRRWRSWTRGDGRRQRRTRRRKSTRRRRHCGRRVDRGCARGATGASSDGPPPGSTAAATTARAGLICDVVGLSVSPGCIYLHRVLGGRVPVCHGGSLARATSALRSADSVLAS